MLQRKKVLCYEHSKRKKIFKSAQVCFLRKGTWRVQSLLNDDGIFSIFSLFIIFSHLQTGSQFDLLDSQTLKHCHTFCCHIQCCKLAIIRQRTWTWYTFGCSKICQKAPLIKSENVNNLQQDHQLFTLHLFEQNV